MIEICRIHFRRLRTQMRTTNVRQLPLVRSRWINLYMIYWMRDWYYGVNCHNSLRNNHSRRVGVHCRVSLIILICIVMSLWMDFSRRSSSRRMPTLISYSRTLMKYGSSSVLHSSAFRICQWIEWVFVSIWWTNLGVRHCRRMHWKLDHYFWSSSCLRSAI